MSLVLRFENKSIVITGGARGIGLAIAKRFLSEGANVCLFDRSFPEEFELDDNSKVICQSGDVTKTESISELMETALSHHGTVDVLVNNAGIIRDNVIWRMSEDEFDDVIDVNLKGCWLLCKQVAPIMRKQASGRIVNIASRAWLGNFGQSNYSASKGGLISLTRVLALELARSNVTVNAVAPGLIDTEMTQSLPPEVFQKLVNLQPGKKAGLPDDIAAAVAFIASEEANFITGQVLHVDGGKSIGATVI